MTKTIKLTILITLLTLTTQLFAKSVKFYYKAEKELHLGEVIPKFLKSELLKDDKKKKQVVRETVKLNRHLPDLPLKIGVKTPIYMDRNHIDLYKLKAYYLKERGGDGYTDELDRAEKRANKIANSYNHSSYLGAYYKFTPLYTSEQDHPFNTTNDLSSVFGLGIKGRYSYNNTEVPIWGAFDLSITKFNSPTGYAQTTPVEKKRSLDVPFIGSGKLKAGRTFRKRELHPYGLLEYSSHLGVEYVTAKDQTDVRKIDIFWAGAGVELKLMENRVGLDLSLAYSILGASKLEQFENETNGIEDGDIQAIKLHFSPEYIFKDHYFVGYQFDYINQIGEFNLSINSHSILAGFRF